MHGEIPYFFVGGQAEISMNISLVPDGFSLQGVLLRNGQTYPMTNTTVGDILTMRTNQTSPVLPAGRYEFVLTQYITATEEIVHEDTAEVIFKTPKVAVL